MINNNIKGLFCKGTELKMPAFYRHAGLAKGSSYGGDDRIAFDAALEERTACFYGLYRTGCRRSCRRRRPPVSGYSPSDGSYSGQP
jgi:hypothetical protein